MPNTTLQSPIIFRQDPQVPHVYFLKLSHFLPVLETAIHAVERLLIQCVTKPFQCLERLDLLACI